MLTLTLDERMVNAINAALDDRRIRMAQQLGRLMAQPESPSRDFAIETTRMAMAHALLAQLEIVKASPDPEWPADMSISRLDELELRAQWGDR